MVAKYLKSNFRNSKLPTLGSILRKIVELLINKMKVVRNDNSFANESSTLDNIFAKLDFDRKYLVDIGAADGIRQSPTAIFLNQHGWEGALFEYDSDSFARLAFLYNNRDDLILCKSKVTPFNASQLLKGLNVPRNFEYLNIDIDSYDLSVLRKLFEDGFCPSVISMEINENFGTDLYFEVLWDENHAWNADHFFGCSLVAANSTLKEYGYVLVTVEFNNAIFVRESHSTKFDLPRNLFKAYKEGYLDKSNRFELFPWNKDLEFMHSNISTEEKITRINRMFLKYHGQYILRENS